MDDPLKDILERILQYLPTYFSDLGCMLMGPRYFISDKLKADADMNQTYLFIALTAALCTIIPAPIPSAKDIYLQLASNLFAIFAWIVIFALLRRVAWWAVGDRSAFATFFRAAAYFACVFVIMIVLLVNIGLGVLKWVSPDTFRDVSGLAEASARGVAIAKGSGGTIFMAILLAGFLGIAIWGRQRGEASGSSAG